jgi:hypothetical protein
LSPPLPRNPNQYDRQPSLFGQYLRSYQISIICVIYVYMPIGVTPSGAGGAELGGERSGPYSNYAYAMLGVYEQCSVALAVELFETTYRRSIEKYRAALGAFSTPDPSNLRWRNGFGI